MRQMKRTGIYKASNVSFDPKTCTALSYDWWVFVARFKGLVVYNDFRYSNTTSRHQMKVRKLMRELGIKIDRVVSFKDSLRDVTSLKELDRLQKHQDEINAENAERARLRRNARARERRMAKKAQDTAIVTHASHESHPFQMQSLRLVVSN